MPTETNPEDARAQRLAVLAKFTGSDFFFSHCGQTWGVTKEFGTTMCLCPACGELMMATKENPGA